MITLDKKIEAEFIETFGPLAQKELDSIMSEAIYRTKRMTNKNHEDGKKYLTSNGEYDTIK